MIILKMYISEILMHRNDICVQAYYVIENILWNIRAITVETETNTLEVEHFV